MISKVIGKEQYKDSDMAAVDKFIRSLYTGATCHFIASTRLKNNAKFSFATTTVLSIGLLLIPLFQSADLELKFTSEVLLMIQIFLAVLILVYSIINAKARFNIRAEKLKVCGDKIKKVARELEMTRDRHQDDKSFNYDCFHEKYSSITTDIEDHTPVDYLRAKLKMPQYYEISGLKKFKLILKSISIFILSLAISLMIVAFEFIIILDALGVTSIISPFFNALIGSSS